MIPDPFNDRGEKNPPIVEKVHPIYNVEKGDFPLEARS